MIDVLTSTKPIINNTKHVNINKDKIKEFANKVKEEDLELSEMTLFNEKWTLDEFQQLYFIFNTQTFCFWSEKGKPKWTIEHNGRDVNGSVALAVCLEKVAKQNPDFLKADYLAKINTGEVTKIFKGNVEIPLFQDRVEYLREIGQILTRKYDGKYLNVVKEANNNAETLLEILISKFPNFVDTSNYKGKPVGFYKRAQLQVKGTDTIFRMFDKKGLKNLETLTAFADYKIPQIMRAFGILEYSEELADKVENYIVIEKDSIEELEIRASMVWAVEYLRDELQKRFENLTTIGEIDSMLWVKSQDQQNMKPYHRTCTTAY